MGHTTYEFGPFRIETGERLLRRGGSVIPLSPKAIDTLLALASSGGRAMAKEELIESVWPDTFVEEGGLARNISLLRKAMGDGPDDVYIETIPRRGYRFVVSVREVGKRNTEKRSLAVLPLANLVDDPAQDYFADGMTEELISQFMRINALRVTPRTSVVAYRASGKPLRQVARDLDVDWVVEGSVLQADGRVRISARLIEAATETCHWSETYDRDVRNVLALQSEVAGDIAREIRVTLTIPEQDRLAQSRTVTPDAYRDYLRGRYFLGKRTTADLTRSRNYFRSAIDCDPTYAPAHSGLADTYAMMASSGYDMMSPKDAMPLARSAARKALEMDATLAEAQAALGLVALIYDWDWPAAERCLERAIQLNPNYATAHQWKGEFLMAQGQPRSATAAFQRAVDLDPLSIPSNMGLGWSYYFSREYESAIEQYRRTLEIAPDVPMALYGLGMSYHHLQRMQDGLLTIQRAHSSSGGEPAAVMLVGVSRALTGNRAGAEAELVRLATLRESRYVPAVYSAFIAAALNDVDRAFVWLDKACEERSSYLIFLAVQPAIDNLRADPRYAALLERIGLLTA